MKITYFIRNNNQEYSELCNKATIKIFKSNKVYYVGAQWGEHTPSDVIDFINVNPDEVSCHQWYASKGYYLEEVALDISQEIFDNNTSIDAPVSDGVLDI